MTPTQGYYSLIQFCPDPARREAVNIGVLLFLAEPHFLRVKIAKDNGPIRRLVATRAFDRERINGYKLALEKRLVVERDRIDSLEALVHFIDTRANLIQLTPPRATVVTNPYADLDRLFSRLVGGRSRSIKRPRLDKALSDRLTAEGAAEFLESNITVELPMIGQSLTVPLAFQNGRYHLIQPIRLGETQDPTGRLNRLATQGHLLFRYPDRERGDLQLTVVAEMADSAKDSTETIRKFLREFDVEFFEMAEVGRLAEEIKTTGKRPTEAG